MGFSTLTEAMIFKRTATRKNVRSGIVAHDEDATNNLYRMTKLFYERLPGADAAAAAGAGTRGSLFSTMRKGMG